MMLPRSLPSVRGCILFGWRYWTWGWLDGVGSPPPSPRLYIYTVKSTLRKVKNYQQFTRELVEYVMCWFVSRAKVIWRLEQILVQVMAAQCANALRLPTPIFFGLLTRKTGQSEKNTQTNKAAWVIDRQSRLGFSYVNKVEIGFRMEHL